MNTVLKSLVIVGLMASFAGSAHADGDKQQKKNFKKDHPRRAQVLGRANKQEDINNKAAVDGKLTDKQARKLDREDQSVKRQEQRQADRDGGHITPGEQAKDDREMNKIADQRQNMENKDAVNKSQ